MTSLAPGNEAFLSDLAQLTFWTQAFPIAARLSVSCAPSEVVILPPPSVRLSVRLSLSLSLSLASQLSRCPSITLAKADQKFHSDSLIGQHDDDHDGDHAETNSLPESCKVNILLIAPTKYHFAPTVLEPRRAC